ncbi:aminoglycoside 3'-phosphotransferase [Agrococcus sp. SCSIO52902]|uniref:aminoglycoside 3'-phosphotransferase n=1 Tax=Agrococcus sp. SCSIO52902 TaxID=2933290 RepID=UPI001FF3EE41|nr:aminoglycoside 3'-phosphotransferase [Agrococcus sp. SCSIO52902]UOW00155.1 aminoglycoside 3'-phosphotransferase [Agrococcus sp. SCSIO52902]
MRSGPSLDLAGPPPAGTPVPPPIARRAGHDPVELVWRNELGGVTARIDRIGGAVYAKWSPVGAESLAAEEQRMRWLATASSVPVPRVLGLHREAGGELLETAAIPAPSIVSAAGLHDPDAAAAALGEGLRRLHATDARTCPFPAPDWTASAPVDDPVVCHGDPCAPNTLIADGRFAGLVDLGRVGVGDRWSDLAIASWSLAWNGLGDAEPAFWAAYGAAPDPERIRRWRALWEPPELD